MGNKGNSTGLIVSVVCCCSVVLVAVAVVGALLYAYPPSTWTWLQSTGTDANANTSKNKDTGKDKNKDTGKDTNKDMNKDTGKDKDKGDGGNGGDTSWDAKVTVYNGQNFKTDQWSSSYQFGVGDYRFLSDIADPNMKRSSKDKAKNWEDYISSIKVPAGLKVTLYEHPDFKGKHLTLKAGNYPYLNYFKFGDDTPLTDKNQCKYDSNWKLGGCWSNIASSMKVEKA